MADYHRVQLIIAFSCVFYPVLALNNCDFPAIFNFGDSNSDTGGFSAAFEPLLPPYGETYFGKPAGRFSDGRLTIDFIAETFGLPYLSAYLDSVGSNFTTGANLATAGSTIRPQPSLPLGRFSPFYLNIQYSQFLQLKSGSLLFSEKGGFFKTLLPKEDYFDRALYTFDIGQNDLTAAFFDKKSTSEIKASIPDMLSNFSANVKALYDQGGRSFWIHNTGPIGCLPGIFVNLPVTQLDNAGCAANFNDIAQFFNSKLKDAVVQLRKDLTLAAITYVDIYTVKYTLISNANKYGFEHPFVVCCGYGVKYNYSGLAGCDTTINVNGTKVVVGSCEKPSTRVNWDGIHYTEAANKWVYDQIVDGKFSDPPTPLRMACHK
ncbi:hypothetical protein GIB67_004607 [Kingdonia uniflora]|uniref:Uncharacterized protein n=1 Tax=Kingdonia uniflora TaxID=39325 RepID=A0A7J7MDE9_9MAGN|nr:hypothetical protein GIB67_004607 [Kingdonia uniflora]